MTKTDRFKEISSIYSSLSNPEKDTLMAYVKSLEGRSHKEYDQTEDLFGILEREPDIQKNEMLKKLKIDKETKLFVNGFLLRVREILLESLVLTGNIDRPGEYSNKFRNQVFIRKKLLEASILLSRGERDDAEKLLLEVESRAEKYELPEQVVEAKQMLKLSYTGYRSSRVITRYSAEIDHWIPIDSDMQRAKNLYSDAAFQLNRLPESQGTLKKIIDKLGAIEKKTGLVTVLFFRKSLEARMKMALLDFKGAVRIYKDLLEHRLNSPPVQSDKGVSEVKFQMGLCAAYQSDFKRAKLMFSEADDLLKNDTYESYLLRKYMLMLDFYQTPTSETEEIISKRIGSTYVSRVPYALASYYLLRAIYMIADNRAGKAADLLTNELDAIKKSPTDDSFYRNAYLFIAGAEVFNSEPKKGKTACQRALKNMKSLNKKELGPRHNLIQRSFQKIFEFGFNYKEFISRNPALMEKLESGKGETRWVPFTNEVMSVHAWIHHQMDRRKKLFKA